MLGEQECSASSGWKKDTENGRQLRRCHKLPVKISWCTQQWPGLETEAAMSGEPAGPGWQLGETWMPWALAVKPSSCPSCLVLPSLSTMYPYSWLGKGELESKGSWVPWNRVCMGRRKEREHGGKWFACCPDAMILSLGNFRAFHCGHLKAGSSLGLQGFGCSCWALAGIFPKAQTEGTFWWGARLRTCSLLTVSFGPGLS